MARLVVLLLVGLILFEPQDLPKIARLVGRAMADLHRMAGEFSGIVQELAAMDSEESSPPPRDRDAKPQTPSRG